MIAIVHSIYLQSVHALALNAGSMDNNAGRYCTCTFYDDACLQIFFFKITIDIFKFTQLAIFVNTLVHTVFTDLLSPDFKKMIYMYV